MSQPPPKSFSGRKHRVWCEKTLAINLFWWLTYFKSILTSLQTLQCILCLPHIKHNFTRTTPPLRQNQILGASWLATTRVLPKVRETTLETRLLVLIIFVRYTAISKSFIKSKTSTIKKNRSLYWGLRYIEVRYVEVPLYIHFKFLVACEQALCLGKKIARKVARSTKGLFTG